MQLAEYDFPVSLKNVFVKSPTGEYTEVDGSRAVVRDDTNLPISIVSKNYKLFKHTEVVEKVKPFLERFGDYRMKSFVEKGGARAVMQYTFDKNTLEVPKVGDKVAFRMLVTNSYDSTKSLSLRVGAMVLKCLNGMTASTGEINLFYRHTKQLVDIEMPDPDFLYGIFEDTIKDAGHYVNIDTPKNTVSEYTDQLTKLGIISKKGFNANIEEFQKSNNMWDLYNAVTYVITHKSDRVMESSKVLRLDRLNKFTNAFIKGSEAPREPEYVQ